MSTLLLIINVVAIISVIALVVATIKFWPFLVKKEKAKTYTKTIETDEEIILLSKDGNEEFHFKK